MTQPHDSRLVRSLLVLTVTTGLIDAVSYLALGHVFTANMTGNVVFLAFAIAGAPGFSIPRSAVSLGAFLAGAVAGGSLAARRGNGPPYHWIAAAFAGEAVLLFAAALAGTVYAVIVLTALAMGLRNATVRSIAVPDLTTTVLTLTLTGLAADSGVAGGANPRAGRRAASVLSMFLGAGVGALMVRRSVMLPLVVCGVLAASCVVAVGLLGHEND